MTVAHLRLRNQDAWPLATVRVLPGQGQNDKPRAFTRSAQFCSPWRPFALVVMIITSYSYTPSIAYCGNLSNDLQLLWIIRSAQSSFFTDKRRYSILWIAIYLCIWHFCNVGADFVILIRLLRTHNQLQRERSEFNTWPQIKIHPTGVHSMLQNKAFKPPNSPETQSVQMLQMQVVFMVGINRRQIMWQYKVFGNIFPVVLPGNVILPFNSQHDIRQIQIDL